MSATYPAYAVEGAVRCILKMCRDAPVAVDVTDLSDEDSANLMVTWHRIGERMSGDFNDLVTYIDPKRNHDVAVMLLGMGCKVVDYAQLMRAYV